MRWPEEFAYGNAARRRCSHPVRDLRETRNATRGPPAAPKTTKSKKLPANSEPDPARGAKSQKSAKGGRVARKSAKSADSPVATLQDSPVTVVGIGASAGGLEALSEFFRHVPAKTGVAYMIVQHLSPTHGSILAELLAKHATIPIREAADGERIAVDRAYVIAPDTKMTLTDGHLKLVPRDPNVRPPLPIDALFRSLADVQESRTIGVILSGTGSDGALGVRAIRGAGGITFVQDPVSASSQGMPLAAIATNCVDVVATPAEIATHVARLGDHPYLRPDVNGALVSGGNGAAPHDDNKSVVGSATVAQADEVDAAQPAIAEVTRISALLRRRFGVNFALYKIGTVERRIRRRMALRKVETLRAYVDMLGRDASELDTLYGDLLIGVTRFFRDPDVYAALTATILPALLERHAEARGSTRLGEVADGAPLRVWIAGCSTGEEAYSIAISIAELLDAHSPGMSVQIFATDLSAAAITAARVGFYPVGIEADVSPERLRRFFTREESGYRVIKAVRDVCVFAVQNITADPPFSHLDMVSCRNVLIYLQPSAHARLLAVFHYALKQGGILLLGTSESTGTAPTLFTHIDKKHRIYSRTPGAARAQYLNIAAAQPERGPGPNDSLQPPLMSSTHGDDSSRESGRTPAVPDVQRAADHVVIGSYAPAAVVVDDDLHIIQFRGQTGAYIEPTAGTASFHLLKMVKPALTRELRRAIKTARDEARTVRVERVSFHNGPKLNHVTLDIVPFRVAGSAAQYFVISFEDASGKPSPKATLPSSDLPAAANATGTTRSASAARPGLSPSRARKDNARELGEARQELEAAQRHIQAITEEHAAVIEEYQAANEEIQSSNEELQSTNEEIETSKEELQSLNEELTTLNDELRVRNADADRLNDDLHNLLSAMHIPVIMVGTDLRIRRFTEGAERLVNLIPSDVGRPVGDIRSSIDVANLEDMIRRVIETLTLTELEVRDRDGHWYMMHVRPYRTSEARIDGAVIVFHDIDARKLAAEQLDAARRYAEAIVQTVREPLLVLDWTLHGVSANEAFYTTFETTPRATIGHPIFEIGEHSWDNTLLRELLARTVATGEPFDNVEIQTNIELVGQQTMCLSGRRIAAAHNGPPLVLLAMEDITQRKRAELRLATANTELSIRADELEVTSDELRGKTVEAEASNRAKADFLATMSHELRTPLNAIAGYTQLLDMGIRGPVTEAQRVDLARIARSQRHLMGLINEILNFAKLEAGTVAIAEVDVNVDAVLVGVTEMIGPQMHRKNLRYDVRSSLGIDSSTLAVRGDEDKIRQIILNLLTNALKFTAAGGAVEVRYDADESAVYIRVRDTGVGIAQSELGKIFEPFVQINPLLTRSTDGVGLGLAISRALARAMGGDVLAESSLGSGSTFTLTLGRAQAAVHATA